MKIDKSTAWRQKHSDFNVPCLAMPKIQNIIPLKNTSGNSGTSKFQSYSAFDIHFDENFESLVDATNIIYEEYIKWKKKKSRYRWDHFYYYTPISNDDLIKFYLDDSLNCDIMLHDELRLH
jgi:hypothetical protein